MTSNRGTEPTPVPDVFRVTSQAKPRDSLQSGAAGGDGAPLGGDGAPLGGGGAARHEPSVAHGGGLVVVPHMNHLLAFQSRHWCWYPRPHWQMALPGWVVGAEWLYPQ